jgi:hypothetical protein
VFEGQRLEVTILKDWMEKLWLLLELIQALEK